MKILNLNDWQIKQAIKDGQVTISVFGAGKVGLPIAVVFAETGAQVIAVDIDRDLVEKINLGKNPVENELLLDEKFSAVIKKRKISASTDLVGATDSSDVIIVIVPTIIDERNVLSMDPLNLAFESIGKGLKKETLVILESTVPPGFMEGKIRPVIEKESGLIAGSDFGLGFSPERVYSGRVIPDLVENYPKIISGINEKTVNVMESLYGLVVKREIIKMSSIKVAETMKVFEGIYRDVNLALANELALVAEKLHVDIMEVINAANTQPFSNILVPGAGVGGHCIPVYPYFILQHQEIAGLDLQLVRAARNVNERMPFHIVELLEEGFREIGSSYQKSNIMIMGLAFRGDVKEYRNSPSLDVVKILKTKSKKIMCFDPLFSVEEIFAILGIKGVDSLEQAFRDVNALIFLTDHKMFKELDLSHFSQSMAIPKLIIDGRQLFIPKEVLELEVHYKGVGRVS